MGGRVPGAADTDPRAGAGARHRRELVREHRLVTIVGTGGCGKTRLAVEIARDDPDAVFVDLAPLTDAGLVLPTVARACGLSEAGAGPVATRRCATSTTAGAARVLDNLEHLLDAADAIVDLLTGCSGVRVLGTSRSRPGAGRAAARTRPARGARRRRVGPVGTQRGAAARPPRRRPAAPDLPRQHRAIPRWTDSVGCSRSPGKSRSPATTPCH